MIPNSQNINDVILLTFLLKNTPRVRALVTSFYNNKRLWPPMFLTYFGLYSWLTLIDLYIVCIDDTW